MGSSFPRGLVVQGLALTFLAVDLRGSQPAIDRGSAPGAVAAAPSSAAIQVYRASCLECHDSDGRGEVGRDASPTIPNFTDAKWQASRGDAELSHSILEGKGKSMPKMKNKLGSVQANQMVAFVRAFQGGKQVVEDEPDEPSPPEQPRVATESTGSGLSTRRASATQLEGFGPPRREPSVQTILRRLPRGRRPGERDKG